ncbi:hypothetical protein ERJ75_000757200 [Trypanosoma vivax]|nr:hypothetical protein ERJ75_000757200 [Trypanosoma vivax]
MQHIVSFLISRVAKIADVAPSNVESSLSERTVCLRNLTLRTDTVNSMSGLRISSGRIEELHFQLPLPTSTTPLVIRPVGVTIVLSDLSPQGKNTEMTPDAIRRGITTESIIGMTECATPPRGAAMRKDESAHGPTVVGSRGEEESTGIGSDWENSDDDYFSCHSGTEITTSCQETVADGNTNLQGGGGVFSFLKSVANISVSWLFNRATLVHATNITLVFLSSVSDSFRLELEVREIIAQVEPLQQMNSDRIRVGRGTLSTVTLCACTNESRTNIITADNLTICVTMVYNLLGVLCRQNTAVTCQEGVSLFVNPTALRSLTSCMANYRRATEFPEYSRPFAHLRHARWKFAKCCVVELLRDRRRRYNFSLQHLHFYREARQWYLKLLEDCHLTGDVAGRIDELVEAERDLRYHDVVTFLRQKARQWYSGFTVADDVGLDSASQPTRTSTVMSSVHVNLREICVQTLPNMQLRVVDIEFVSRVKEVSVGIGNVLVVCSGITESLCVPAGRSGVLFYFRLLEKGTTVSLQVKLRPVKVSLTTEEGLGALRSVAEVAPPLLREVLYCNVGSSTTSSCVPAAATTPRTRAVAITAPLIQLQLDQIFFTCENLFLTWRFAEDASRSRFSCSFSDLSLCFGTGGEAVFAPVCARSARGHAVSVSIVKATCSIRLWNYLKQVWGTWRSVWFDLMEAINVVDQAQQGMVGVAAGVTMENVRWVATAQKEFRRNWESQQITVAGVVFKFEPLNMEIHIGRIGAFPSERWSGGTAAHISIESIYLISEEDNGTVVSLEIPCMAHCVITGASSDASTGTRCFLVSAGSLKLHKKSLYCSHCW